MADDEIVPVPAQTGGSEAAVPSTEPINIDTLQLVLCCKQQAIVHLLGLVLSYQHTWIVILSRNMMMTLIC
jgi:hypothetical protein